MTKAMPAELAKLYDQLWQEVVWIHGKWEITLQLYTDEKTIDLLNNTAPSFFIYAKRCYAMMLSLLFVG